jgi:alkanesulfonate monooxygenase SsuD/methylene tetrahydromethanopterin reductase-like flavin-dependent oxidoreductase (luciferase family)
VRIGLKLAPINVGYDTLERAWIAGATSDAFDSLWSFDHLYPSTGPGPCLEGWTVLAVLAHHARDKELGHLVLAAPFRQAAVLAKAAAVMDLATAGRFVLGLGAGHNFVEAQAFDLPLPEPIGKRMQVLEATLRSVRSLWGAPDHARDVPPVTGSVLPFEQPPGALFEPAPRTPGGPRILIGTAGERIGLRLVARYADAWNQSGADDEAFARKRDIIAANCAAIGRDPASVELTCQARLSADDDGATEAVAAARRLAAAGCDHLILMADASQGPAAVAAVETLARRIRDAAG